MDGKTSQSKTPETMVKNKTSLLFSIGDKVGGLAEVLDLIRVHRLNMIRIESRPSKTDRWDYDFFIDLDLGATDEEAEQTRKELQKLTAALQERGIGVLTPEDPKKRSSSLTASTAKSISNVPWFPRKLSDLDQFVNKTLEYGSELDSDHPGFTDPEYRKRRVEITENARRYKHGQEIPRVKYTEQEISTWRTVYSELTRLYKTHACRQHNYVFPLLEANCGYGPDNIPQLQDVSNFLQECTGWRLRPVQGLLSSRDFLNGLAFRVFHSTQYIRHHSQPLYTPEPDVCHELLGHVPLYADPDFAEFSQEIGLASLGASDDDIQKLATLYWFTVEFGLCKEDDNVKAYGAGLLSSFGELKYSLGGDEQQKPDYKPFDPSMTAITNYPITQYQPTYFVAESFQDAKKKLLQWVQTLDRQFAVRYNSLTCTVEILDSRDKLTRFVREIQSNLTTLSAAIAKLPDSNIPLIN